MNATQLLHDLGQSLWLDNITRDLLDNGTLQRYSRWDAAVMGKVPEALRNNLGIAVAQRTYKACRTLLSSSQACDMVSHRMCR
jgi:hypothetical protein